MQNDKSEERGEEEPLTEERFRQIYNYQPPEVIPVAQRIKKTVKCSSSTLTNYLPILKWLPKYSFRRDFTGDLITGLTVAIMHIPHGLAYAPLAGQPPVVGLYMAVFPIVVYFFLGTSRHLSLGTFAVMCMMVGKTVSEHSLPIGHGVNITSNNSFIYSHMEVGVTVCFLVGLWQFVMGTLQMGALWLLLSNCMVSGFTAAAAVHVVTYQVKNLLGVPGKTFSGPFKLLFTVVDLCKKVPETNLVTLGLSCCSIVILVFFNEYVKPLVQKKFPNWKVPIPIELIVIGLGIVASYFLDLEVNHDVHIVKTVPTGLPEPVVPIFALIPDILVDCFVIAVVGISMSLSLAAIFSKKAGYDVDQNQELIAYGASNVFASFFQCVPSCASLSRSYVLSALGGKSQFAGIITMSVLILILLFLGPLFEPVPYSVLSSIVVVTLKGLLWQVKEFPKTWKQSKLDGAVWLITFLAVVLIDLDIGLGIGFCMSVLSLILRGQSPKVIRLGRIPGSQLFVDANLYQNAEIFPHVLVLKITGFLHFANFATLQEKIMSMYRDFTVSHFQLDDKTVLHVVLDFGCVPSVDPTAVIGLEAFYKDLKAGNCDLILTECHGKVYDYLEHCKFFETFPKKNVLFSTYDAVEYLSGKKTK